MPPPSVGGIIFIIYKQPEVTSDQQPVFSSITPGTSSSTARRTAAPTALGAAMPIDENDQDGHFNHPEGEGYFAA